MVGDMSSEIFSFDDLLSDPVYIPDWERVDEPNTLPQFETFLEPSLQLRTLPLVTDTETPLNLAPSPPQTDIFEPRQVFYNHPVRETVKSLSSFDLRFPWVPPDSWFSPVVALAVEPLSSPLASIIDRLLPLDITESSFAIATQEAAETALHKALSSDYMPVYSTRLEHFLLVTSADPSEMPDDYDAIKSVREVTPNGPFWLVHIMAVEAQELQTARENWAAKNKHFYIFPAPKDINTLRVCSQVFGIRSKRK